MSLKSNSKKCQRCGKFFECNAENILLCGCNDISLNENQRKLIAEKYSDCLCVSCLQEVKRGTIV